MKRIMIVLTVAGMLVATSVWAGSLTVPNTFQGGQKALASEVNANFDEVEAEVTDNAYNISSNETSITQNAAGIASNAASIADVKTNKLDVISCADGQLIQFEASSGTYICTDSPDLNSLQSQITDNAIDISDNASIISSIQSAIVSTMVGYVSYARDGLSRLDGSVGNGSLHLPQNAVVKKLTLYYNDTSNLRAASCSLVRKELATGSTSILAQVASTATFEGGLGTDVDDTIDSPVVDNQIYAYYVGPADGSFALLLGLVIEYEYRLF